MNAAPTPAPPDSRPPRPGGFWAPVLIAIAGLAAYANSFSGPFTLDDKTSIVDNPTIRHLWPIWSALRPPVKSGVGGRPVLNLSFGVNYALGDVNVWGYHAANLAIHILAGVILLEIMRRTLTRWRRLSHAGGSDAADQRLGAGAHGRGTALAFAIALVWTVHPLQTEAVTYVSQRAESLMGLFYLLTLYGFIRYAEGGGIWNAAFSVVSCLLGMGTKEVMVTAPLAVLLYDRTFVSGTFGEAWRRRWRYYAGLASTWLLLGFLLRDVRERGVGLGLGGAWWEYALMESRVIVRYLGLAVWPHPLVFDYGSGLGRQTWAVAPYVAVNLILLAGAAWALFRPVHRGRGLQALGFAWAWVLLILAPTSSVVAVAGQPMAEHRMYLPLAAVVAAVAVGLHGLLGRRSLPLLLSLALASGWLTWKRNGIYGSEERIWGDTVARCPDNVRAHNNLGLALQKIPGRSNEAIAQYEEALRLDPKYEEAHNNLGIALEGIPGRLDEAIAQYEEALRLMPDVPEAHYNLGSALAKNPGRLDEAVAQYEEALRLNPDYVKAHNNLGSALARIPGRLDEAVAQYGEALRLKPDYAEAHYNLANALAKMPGRLDEAVAQYEEALRLTPGVAAFHFNLAVTLLRIPGRTDEAATQLREVLRLQPDYGPARQLLARIGKPEP